MADFGDVGKSAYPCPMCGTPVPAMAHWCSTCGLDLTRAGAVITSAGHAPAERKPRTPGILMTSLLAVGVLAVVGVGLLLVATPARNLHLKIPARTPRPPAVADAPAARPIADVAVPIPHPVAATRVPTATKPAGGPSVAFLTVATSPPGAQVQLDGRVIGSTPVTLNDLKAGRYRVRITHEGYQPVSRVVTLQAGDRATVAVTLNRQEPPAQNVASQRETAASSPKKEALLAIGQLAPTFVAKDRIGILYRPTDFRGKNLLIVFVPRLDAAGQRIIREVNTLVATGKVDAALAVVVHPDRTAIRQFMSSAQIQAPVLFGTEAMAKAYGATGNTAVLYLVSGDGRVARRQAGRLDVSAALR